MVCKSGVSPEGASRRGKRTQRLIAALVSATTERKKQEKDGSLGVYDSRALVSALPPVDSCSSDTLLTSRVDVSVDVCQTPTLLRPTTWPCPEAPPRTSVSQRRLAERDGDPK